jgi:hypothetical protein
MDTVTATSQAIELENGNRYEGPLKNGLPDGRGKLTYSENDPRESYEGTFVNGELEGTGLMTWRNGKKYEGEFHNNNIKGTGTMSIETRLVNLKEIKSGTFIDGKLHGKGKIQLNEDGKITLKEGSFENNQLKKGTITTTYKKHQKKEIREGNFKNEELNGEGGKITITQYDEIIELRIGSFENGKLHGENGTAKIIENYVTFLLSGEWQDGYLWNGKKESQNKTIKYVNGEVNNPCFCVML